MKNYGCAVVATARVISSVRGYDCPPGDWLTWLQGHGGFMPGGRIIWSKVTEYLVSKGFCAVKPTSGLWGASYVIWHVAFGPLGHYVNHRDSDHTILDPWDGKQKSDRTYRRISGTIYYK
jgi:hypothetical protein